MLVHVDSMCGQQVQVQADSLELVANLRFRVAKALGKPLKHLVLAHGTRVLHGMEVVGDVVGASECVHISAILTREGGPVEEWMDEGDPQGLTEYMPDLHLKLVTREAKVHISATYMERQADISAKWRTILVDWLVDVQCEYRLSTRTLFLAVSLIDRYLQEKQMSRKRLQLLGIASMFVASKFEAECGNDGPELDLHDCVYLVEEIGCGRADVISMEIDLLTLLQFDLCAPTAAHFMDLYQQANRCESDHCFAAEYVLELSLLDLEIVSEAPSKCAAAAVLLSNQMQLWRGDHFSGTRDEPWPSAMAVYTGYSEAALQAVAQKMRQLYKAAPTSSLRICPRNTSPLLSTTAVFRKFSNASRRLAGHFPTVPWPLSGYV